MIQMNLVKKTKKRKFKSNKKSGIFDHPSDEVVKKQMWPQTKLQFEYVGSNIDFDDLEPFCCRRVRNVIHGKNI